MEVVLKSNKDISSKVSTLDKECFDNHNNILMLIVNSSMFSEANKVLDGMKLSSIKYGKEKLYISEGGVKINLVKVDRYI